MEENGKQGKKSEENVGKEVKERVINCFAGLTQFPDPVKITFLNELPPDEVDQLFPFIIRHQSSPFFCFCFFSFVLIFI